MALTDTDHLEILEVEDYLTQAHESSEVEESTDEDLNDENHEEYSEETPLDNTESTPENQASDKPAIVIFAEQWKSDGRLPSDFKITNELTEEEIDKALYDHSVKVLVDTKLQEKLKEFGINEQELQIKKSVLNGVDPNLHKQLEAYTALSSLNLDTSNLEDDDNKKDIKDYLTYYYQDLGMPKSKAVKTAESDLDDTDELSNTVKEANKYFNKRKGNIKDQISSTEDANSRKVAEKKQARIDKENSLLSSRKISGNDISEAQEKFLKEAFTAKNQIVKVGDSLIKTTLYDKLAHEYSNDPEKALWAKIQLLLPHFKGDDTPEEKAGKKILKQLNFATNKTNNINKKIHAEVELL